MTYAELVERLAAIGIDDNECNLRNKVGRGKFRILAAMLFSNRGKLCPSRGGLVAACVLIAALCSAGLAQELSPEQPSGPATEGQPVPNGGVDKAAQHGDGKSQQDSPHPIDLTPALDRIESAIRDFMTQQGASKPNWEEQRHQIEDLQAQKDMAVWAEAMFWATAGGVLLTFAGLILIGFTLHHTRRAVDYAKDMVGEAKKATVAANLTVVETTRIGEAQVRAYLYCKAAKYERVKDRITAVLIIENTGQSPAIKVRVTGCLVVNEVIGRSEMPRVAGWAVSDQNSIDCQPIPVGGSTREEITFFWEFDFKKAASEGDERKRIIFNTGNEIEFDLKIRWSDVFDKRHDVSVNLWAAVDATPSQPKKKRSRAGVLRLRTAEARHGVQRPDNESESEEG